MRLLVAAIGMGCLLACHQPEQPPVPPRPTNPTNGRAIAFQRVDVIDASIVSDGAGRAFDASGLHFDSTNPAR
jgi:hypothetical protein